MPPLNEPNAPPTQLNSQQLEVLKELVNSNSDATLEELRHQLAAAEGIFISRSTVDRILGRLNLTRKKKRCTRQKKELKKYNFND